MKLIMNADDYGMNRGVTMGVARAMRDGIVSDTTMMVGMPYAEEGARLLKSFGIQRIGLHLTLTCGKPVLPAKEVPSLVDEAGNFYPNVAEMLKYAQAADVEKEYEAQVAKFFSLGLGMTHIDSHHHSHFYGDNFEIALRIAKEMAMPMRHHNREIEGRNTKEMVSVAGLKTTDDFSIKFYGEGVSIYKLQEEITSYMDRGCKSLEVMCHPAYVEQELMLASSYNLPRANELVVLTSYEMKRFIREKGIHLCSFDYI